MGSNTLQVEIATSPVYEFLLSLVVWADSEHEAIYEVGPEWFAAIRARASPDLLRHVADLGQQCDMVWAHLLTFAAGVADVPTYVALLAQTDPIEIQLRLVGHGVRYFQLSTPPAVMHAAVLGDPAARREFLRTSYPEDARWQAALVHLLAMNAEVLRAELIAILREWYATVFLAQEAALASAIACDADQRLAMLARGDPMAVIDAVTYGYEYIPEDGITRVILVPAVLPRPQMHTFDHAETKWICYPVADDCLDRDPHLPPPRLLRLLKALADERRLRILRLLATGAAPLSAITAHVGLSKTLTHHHLTVLRGAGLVVNHGGTQRIYTLRYDTLAEVAPLLDGYLAPPPRNTTPPS